MYVDLLIKSANAVAAGVVLGGVRDDELDDALAELDRHAV